MLISDDVRSDDVRAEDVFVERFRHSEFLYSRNGRYKTVELKIYEKQHVEKFPTIDLLEIDHNNVKLDDEFKIHYENGPCDISKKKKKDWCMHSKRTSFKKGTFICKLCQLGCLI